MTLLARMNLTKAMCITLAVLVLGCHAQFQNLYIPDDLFPQNASSRYAYFLKGPGVYTKNFTDPHSHEKSLIFVDFDLDLYNWKGDLQSHTKPIGHCQLDATQAGRATRDAFCEIYRGNSFAYFTISIFPDIDGHHPREHPHKEKKVSFDIDIDIDEYIEESSGDDDDSDHVDIKESIDISENRESFRGDDDDDNNGHGKKFHEKKQHHEEIAKPRPIAYKGYNFGPRNERADVKIDFKGDYKERRDRSRDGSYKFGRGRDKRALQQSGGEIQERVDYHGAHLKGFTAPVTSTSVRGPLANSTYVSMFKIIGGLPPAHSFEVPRKNEYEFITQIEAYLVFYGPRIQRPLPTHSPQPEYEGHGNNHNDDDGDDDNNKHINDRHDDDDGNNHHHDGNDGNDDDDHHHGDHFEGVEKYKHKENRNRGYNGNYRGRH